MGANPDASRYAGMKPRRLITLTMSLAGMLAGLAGTGNILGINHQMNATFSTTVGFDAITVALLGRSHPIGVMLAALLFGAMRAGAGLMQIKAGVPAELVDLLQAIILLFLVASPVISRLFRLRDVQASLGTTDTMSKTYGSKAIAMTDIPVLGLVIQFSELPDRPAAVHRPRRGRGRHPDRACRRCAA